MAETENETDRSVEIKDMLDADLLKAKKNLI